MGKMSHQRAWYTAFVCTSAKTICHRSLQFHHAGACFCKSYSGCDHSAVYLFETCQTRTPGNCLAKTSLELTASVALLHKKLKGCTYAPCWCVLALCCDRILVDVAEAVVSFAAGSCRCYTVCVHSVHKSRHKPACSAVRPTVTHC